MVSLRRHFVPNPVTMHSTVFRSKSSSPRSIHTRYDLASRLTGLTHSKGATTLADYGWSYDAAGRITQFVSSTRTDESATYSYLCPCQLAGLDFFGRDGFFGRGDADRTVAGVAASAGTTEMRLAGGAGGGNERPCSSARCRRKSGLEAAREQVAARFTVCA